MDETNRLRDALKDIARVASTAVGDDDAHDSEYDGGPEHFIPCAIRSLPARLLVRAAQTAIKVNPANAPAAGPVALLAEGSPVSEPMRAAIVTSKYWGPSPRQLTVSFLEPASTALRKRILSHMNAWSTVAGISFVLTDGVGDVRISLGPGGYYSYLGTDILHIPRNRQTMNLEGFSMSTSEREYRRVVRHETGHTLGFPHEHMRKELVDLLDPPKTYAYFLRTQRWDRATVDAQVLTPLNNATIIGTPPDQTSIMCYQLPGEITKSGKPIPGGLDINQTDFAFAAGLYPRPGHAMAGVNGNGASAVNGAADDWPEDEDVDVAVPRTRAVVMAM